MLVTLTTAVIAHVSGTRHRCKHVIYHTVSPVPKLFMATIYNLSLGGRNPTCSEKARS